MTFEWLPFSPEKYETHEVLELRDTQQLWFWRMLHRMMRNEEHLGYLRLDGKLWRVVGARDRGLWEAYSPAVIALFHRRQAPDGQGEFLFHPALLDVIQEQQGRLIHKKSRFSSLSTEFGRASPSHSRSEKEKGTRARDAQQQGENCAPDPHCRRCAGTGWRSIAAHPGREVSCECTYKEATDASGIPA